MTGRASHDLVAVGSGAAALCTAMGPRQAGASMPARTARAVTDARTGGRPRGGRRGRNPS
jgi:hypothetical protein